MNNVLEAIDNSTPSEALECLKHIKKYYIPEPCSAKTYDCLETIKQALLKAQEQKHYIKWEDLEFKENKEIYVFMNGNKYVLELRPKNTRMEYLDEVILYNIEKQGVIVLNEIEAETFNDLHLERVEE